MQKPKVRKVVPKAMGLGSRKAAGTEPVKISHKQMWVDLLAEGVKKEKIDQQPNDVLLALWKQILVGQRFQKLLKKGSSLRPVGLQGSLDSPGEEEFNLLD